MPKLIISYKLKAGVTRETYEQWTRSVDYPSMRGLRRVSSFTNHRVRGLLMGPGAPSVDYVEVFEIADLDGFVTEDMPGAVVQKVMGDFMGFVDDPQFLVVDEVV
ncbi:MAG: hypothetical protein KA224_03655 [Steroidobacteraceae bacterium]|nr:hypothetical protein [Steroidobacteraceae bacterium]MCC7199598.1 REDY-like protein HapK [Gammaproteobacteria bacterium]